MGDCWGSAADVHRAAEIKLVPAQLLDDGDAVGGVGSEDARGGVEAPAVGARAGVGAVDAQFANQVDDEDTVFGYNLGAGLGLALTDDVELEALYRYMSFTGGEFTDTDGDTVDADIDAHTATVGVRFKF